MSIKKIIVPILFFSVLFSIETYGADIHPPDDWAYFHERGMKQFNARMYKDSHDSMVKALRLNPQSYESANILAEIAVIDKNREHAIDYFKQSLGINDNQSGAHNSLGLLLEYFGNNEEAFLHFKRSHEIDTGNLQGMINLSRHYRKRGEKGEADRLFNLCNESAINSSRPLVEDGKLLTKTRPSEAAALYRKAIELNPAHIDAYIALADLYRQEQQYEKAAETIENLKRINTDYAPAYFYLGNIYYNNPLRWNTRKYRITLAIKNIEEGLRLDPGSEDNWFHLAEIYRHIGNRDRAMELEKRGVELMKKGEQANQ